MARTAVDTPLRHPAFRRLWLGLSISYLGDQFTIIALLWFVLQLTGSGAAVGLVILCFNLPGVITGAILGRLLDRYQPRLVIGFDNLARAALIAVIPTLYTLGSLRLWQVFVLALLAGALSPATTAGVGAFVPHVVEEGALDRANALTATSLQFSYLAGPMAAGFAVAKFGGPRALFIDAASFLLMGLLALTMPKITRELRIAQHPAANHWLGFGALFSMRYVRALTLLSLVFFFSYGPLEAALPIYTSQALHANADGYGLLWTGFGVGAFAGVLTLTKLSHRWRPSIALPMIALLWGVLLCPLFFIRQLPLAMLFLGLAGASWAPYTPMETTLLQRLVPAEIRGQVFGARHSLVVAASPLGAAFGGVLLQYLSAPLVIAISGIACVLAGLGGLVSPSLRQLKRETHVALWNGHDSFAERQIERESKKWGKYFAASEAERRNSRSIGETTMRLKNSSEQIVLSCVDAINRGDFKTARQYVSDDMSFVGVLGSRLGADAYFKDMERLQLKYDVKKVFVDGQDVCLLYDLNMSGANTFCCGWYQVQDQKIRSLRVVFDPRPILEARG